MGCYLRGKGWIKVAYARHLLVLIVSFYIVSLASQRVGNLFTKVRLPLISGFLFTGILVGPYVLGLLPGDTVETLRFVDEISLAFIAFAAGSELYLKEFRGRLGSIAWITTGLVLSTFTLGTLAVLFLADYVPFMQSMPLASRIAVAILIGAILVARSPSAAIAIINELRAKGPFTQIALGVTVIMDAVVIILFAINASIADALIIGVGFDFGFLFLLAGELALSGLTAVVLALVMRVILAQRLANLFKLGLLLLAGYSIYIISAELRDWSHALWNTEILIEPLLICMIASVLVTNYSRYRSDFLKLLHDGGPFIYVLFFTLTGASLELDVLSAVWQIAVALFFVRLLGIFIGSFSGGLIAREPMQHNLLRWMAFVTQAGVGLGLAREVAVEFPTWGESFATMIIATIVLNEMVGPLFFKWSINAVGESHERAPTPEFDGVHDVIIFGLEGQSLVLARILQSHGWNVHIASRYADALDRDMALHDMDVTIHSITDITPASLQGLQLERAEAVVTMLSDEENYQVCELIYERFGTKTLVVRLNDPANIERFHELGALIVEPSMAIVGLLAHFVRSPAATSLLLGMQEHQGIVEVDVRNPALYGTALRELRLPLDTLVLSVHRNGHMLVSHGYTRLEAGDRVTVMGSNESLDEVTLRFSR